MTWLNHFPFLGNHFIIITHSKITIITHQDHMENMIMDQDLIPHAWMKSKRGHHLPLFSYIHKQGRSIIPSIYSWLHHKDMLHNTSIEHRESNIAHENKSFTFMCPSRPQEEGDEKRAQEEAMYDLGFNGSTSPFLIFFEVEWILFSTPVSSPPKQCDPRLAQGIVTHLKKEGKWFHDYRESLKKKFRYGKWLGKGLDEGKHQRKVSQEGGNYA